MLDKTGGILLCQVVDTNLVRLAYVRCPAGDSRDGVFSVHTIDTSDRIGEVIQAQFRQHSNVFLSGYFTLIDDVEVKR